MAKAIVFHAQARGRGLRQEDLRQARTLFQFPPSGISDFSKIEVIWYDKMFESDEKLVKY